MRATTVAFVGPDGAGKSSVTTAVVARLRRRAVRIYMGVNLEEANVALPTTRLLMRLKRRRGRRPDLGGWPAARPHRPVRDVVRVLNLIAEEWYRAVIAGYHRRRGRVVIMDRHFLADYWCHDVAPSRPRPWIGRLHGYLLRRWYPRPDHFVFLDAPASVLHARQPDTPIDYLLGRRGEYSEFARATSTVTTIPVDRPFDQVLDRCLVVVEELLDTRPHRLSVPGE